jgi:hypothetical protein
MKELEKLAQAVGMQFEEAVKLFSVETLESMQMVSIMGGFIDHEQCPCENHGQCPCNNQSIEIKQNLTSVYSL